MNYNSAIQNLENYNDMDPIIIIIIIRMSKPIWSTHCGTIIKTIINLLTETLQYHLHSVHENQKKGVPVFQYAGQKTESEQPSTHARL